MSFIINLISWTHYFCEKKKYEFNILPGYDIFIHYVIAYKIIHMYYLKKLHDSLNRLYD